MVSTGSNCAPVNEPPVTLRTPDAPDIDDPSELMDEAVESADRLHLWFVGVVVLALIPRLMTAGRFVTTDEPTWMNRSVRFSDAISSLDLSQATASVGELATMPGAPIMWIGTVARVVWTAGHGLGLVDSSSFTSPDGLAIAQYLAAFALSLLIGGLFLAVARWVGLVSALITGGLVATEPWFVGLGAVLHSDEMTALLGTIGLVVLARVLGIPRRAAVACPRRAAALAGLALMGSALTKLTGAGFWAGAGVLAVWASIVHMRRGGRWFEPSSPLRLGLIAAGAGLVIVPLAWPAIVVDPVFQFERLLASARIANESGAFVRGTQQFYRGQGTNDPGWSYYPVASMLRVTPWFLLAVLVGAPVTLARSRIRGYALALATPIGAFFVMLSVASKAYDRYAIMILVPLVVVAAIGVDVLVRPILRGLTVVVVAALTAAMFGFTLLVVPWGLAFFNPALGGSAKGRETLMVGWGEGLDLARNRIEELEGGDCSTTTVAGLEGMYLVGWTCASPPAAGDEADYLVVYVNQIQRNPEARAQVEARDLIDTVEIRGITYAEIWR